MYRIRPIRSEEDYKAACARILELMDAEAGTSEGDELDVLADLVFVYEDKPDRQARYHDVDGAGAA